MAGCAMAQSVTSWLCHGTGSILGQSTLRLLWTGVVLNISISPPTVHIHVVLNISINPPTVHIHAVPNISISPPTVNIHAVPNISISPPTVHIHVHLTTVLIIRTVR